jgi:hypothetical protein
MDLIMKFALIRVWCLSLNRILTLKINDSPHKLAVKHIIDTIRAQIDRDAETLDSFNLEANLYLVQVVLYFHILLCSKVNFLFIV